MKPNLAIALAAGLLAGCATKSTELTSTYVSPTAYKDYDCDQIQAEQQRVARRASELAGTIDKNASDDATLTGVGIVLFWPALFFLEGDGPQAQEYSRLRGEHEALEQAAIQKRCVFDEPEPAESG